MEEGGLGGRPCPEQGPCISSTLPGPGSSLAEHPHGGQAAPNSRHLAVPPPVHRPRGFSSPKLIAIGKNLVGSKKSLEGARESRWLIHSFLELRPPFTGLLGTRCQRSLG